MRFLHRTAGILLTAVFVLSTLITGTLGWQSLSQQAKNEAQSEISAYTDVELIKLGKLPDGTETNLKLGVGYDEYSAPVTLEVVVKSKGELRGFMYRDHNRAYGYCVTVSVKGLPVDILVASNRQAMVEIHQFTDAGIQLDDYDVIVVKQGYIFPELKAAGKLCVMSLTGGATPQDTASIPFKRIMRPMFPIDQI